MTYVEFVAHVSRKYKIPEDQVRRVADALTNEVLAVAAQGDEVRLQHIGTLYPATYRARSGKLEFGTEGQGGERRRLRLRPFESTNATLTEKWKQSRQELAVSGDDGSGKIIE
jgi:nucleoid DNA-binding protein